MLRNPPILLLDEATAALDNESERLVNEAIDRLLSSSGSRTTIVIAHRLSSIRACEKLIVLEKGAVVEEGTHDELLAINGLYASLFKLSEGTGTLSKTKTEPVEKATSPRSPERKKLDSLDAEDKNSFLLPNTHLDDSENDASDKNGDPTTTNTSGDGDKTDAEPGKRGCCGREGW